ncbi:unnamed protein product, partial [Aphanomyces euteiches]
MKIEDEERRHSDMRGGRRDHEQWRRNDHALRVGQLQCYNCQGFGHKTPDCPSIESFDQSGNVKKKNKSKKHGQKQKKAIETPSDGANLVLNVRGNDKNTAWFGDSGATIHVCAPQDRHLLHDVAKLDTPRVVQGFGAGDSSATSYIKGSIVVDTPQGRRTITDVHYIP